MKKLFVLFTILTFSVYYSQNNIKKLAEITEKISELYVKDTLKKPFANGDYIAISIFSDSLSNKKNIYIETIQKDFNLYKNTTRYKWYKFHDKKIIIFCGLNSNEKCNKYFEKLEFVKIEESKMLLDKAPTEFELDGDIKLWNFFLNKDAKIIKVNGKIIEAEIDNPEGFKKFLKKYSVLKLYQFYKNGNIVYKVPSDN